MSFQITDDEMRAVLSEVMGEVDSLIKAAADDMSLAKSDEGKEESKEAAPEASEGSPEGAPAGEETPGEAAPGAPPVDAAASAPADASAPPDASAAPPVDPAAAGGDMGAPMDPAALEAGYSQMPPEELLAHYQACKKAVFALQGGAGAGMGGDVAGSAAAPPAPPAAPAGPPGMSASAPPAGSPGGLPPGQPPPFLKGEGFPAGKQMAASPGNGGEKIAKSEHELDLERQVKEKDELLERLSKAVEKLTSPQRKAVTGLDYLAKKEESAAPKAGKIPETQAEITARLTTIASQPSLSKNDRHLINRYYEGSVHIEKLEHLFAQ